MTGFHKTRQVDETAAWMGKTKLVDDRGDERSIVHREEFFQGYAKTIIEEGVSVHQRFFSEMGRGKKYISSKSYDRWVQERYYNEKISFLEKKYWIEHQMGPFVNAWIRVGEERDKLANNPRFEELVRAEPKLSILKDREKFLDLHFDEREGKVAMAKAVLHAMEKGQLDLYAKAKGRLDAAATKEFLADGKVGIWLERIFKSKANPKKIEAFVNGTGLTSLSGLIENWLSVKLRYDRIADKFKEREKNDTLPRGLQFFSKTQFLSMHYAGRLRYVEELERRLGDSPDPNNELPIFLEIRHAIDSKDWTEAQFLIGSAKKMELDQASTERLTSMERFIHQVGGMREGKSINDVTEARNRLDTLVERMGRSHSEIAPMIERLLHSPHANRNIHQFRWITYNNIWCRTHGPPYLDDDIARKGASEDNEQLTKFRAEHGMDIGRHDSLNYETADKEYIRKREYSSHKATYMHTNVNSGGVNEALAEWLEHEQERSVLYWGIYAPHADGDPKPMNWNQDLLMMLTEIRSHARTLENAGFMYDRQGRPLIGLN